jgi:hypothetical protein
MLNKNPDNVTGWKDKLAALSCLPGEPVADNNAAWQRLYGRLQEKKRSKKAFWYRAAAVLLPVLVAALWITNKNKKEDKLAKTIPVKEQTITAAAEGAPAGGKDTLALNDMIKTETNTIVNTRNATAPSSPGISSIKSQGRDTVTIDTTVTVKLTPAIIHAPPADTAATAVADLPVKKKLRVIHINELNEQGAPARPVFPGEDYSSVLPFRLINQQVYSTVPSSYNPVNLKITSSKKGSTN